MIKHRDQKLLVKEFISAYKSQVILLREVRKGIQGTNCEAEAEAKATEKCCLLACSSQLAQMPFFFHTTQEHLPWYGMDCECNVTSTSINKQKKKKNAQQVNLCVEGGFQLGPLFPMTIACIELTKH